MNELVLIKHLDRIATALERLAGMPTEREWVEVEDDLSNLPAPTTWVYFRTAIGDSPRAVPVKNLDWSRVDNPGKITAFSIEENPDAA